MRLCTHPEHAQYGMGHVEGPPLETEYAAPEIAVPSSYNRKVYAPTLNQRAKPECEGYTAITGRRITQPPVGQDGFDPDDIFRLANGGADGTTTAAIEKVLLIPGALCTSGPDDGKRKPVTGCQNISNLATLKTALMAEQFVGLAVVWMEEWFTPLRDGTLPLGKKAAGGHIFAVAGWRDAHSCPDGTVGALLCQNSWGTSWGIPAFDQSGGFFYLPYSYLDSTLGAYTQIATSAPSGPVVTRYPFATERTWQVATGKTLSGYDPSRPGRPVLTKTWAKASTAHTLARVRVDWPGSPNPPVPNGYPFLEVVDGAYAGLLIVEAQVKLL